MPFREYYTVDRTPEEVRELWDWACDQCSGKIEHENPYAMGVRAAMEYLMGESESRPQDYKGVFTLESVLRQTEQGKHIGRVGQASINQPAHAGLDGFRPGNPKTLLYKTPVGIGDILTGEGNVNSGDECVRGNKTSLFSS